MKLWQLATFLTVSALTFSGCVGNGPKPKSIVDNSLPIVTLTKNGVFTDMKAVALEWNSVKSDPRVEGIYVYKKRVDSKEKSNKFYDTIKNRFVTHYLDEDVKPETEYSYVFKTFTKEAESISSREIVVKTLPALESVTWIHVIQEMPRSAKIIWRPHINEIVKHYIVERKTLADAEYKKLAVVKGRLSAEYIDEDLKDSHVYKYRVRAVTYNDIVSYPSKEVKVLTKALPVSIENIVASSDLAKKIILTWERTSIKDFLTYNVYRSRSIDGNYEVVHSTKATEYIDNIDKDGKDYFYRVSVVDLDNLESRHDVKSVHGKSLARPTTPSLVGVKLVGKNLEINWKSDDPRVKSFVVEKSIKKSWIETQSEEFVDIRGQVFVDTKVEPKKTYYYKVYSVDAFSIRSEASIEVQFTTKENEGRIIKKVAPKVQKVETEVIQKENNLVKPMDDLDLSEL